MVKNMLTKKRVNSAIDWHSNSESAIKERKHYFSMFRGLISEIERACSAGSVADVRAAFNRYNVHFVDIDDIPRVNLDDPKE